MIDISHQQDQFEVVPTLVPPTLVEVLKSRLKAKAQAQLPQVHTLPIDQMLKARLASFDPETEDAEADNAFYVADLGEVYRQHLRWKALLPRIEPFFGMFFLL
jgi:ornithine decarboxylase